MIRPFFSLYNSKKTPVMKPVVADLLVDFSLLKNDPIASQTSTSAKSNHSY